jgi:hypothetical protein
MMVGNMTVMVISHLLTWGMGAGKTWLFISQLYADDT